MPEPAMIGTYPHPGIPGATLTAGRAHAVDWLNQHRPDSRPTVVDIETYGVEEDAGLGRIKCVSFGVPEAALVLDPRDPYQHELARLVISRAPALVAHAANFDAPSLAVNGMLTLGDVARLWCTLLVARAAEPGDPPQGKPKTLEDCVARYLGVRDGGNVRSMFKALGYNKKDGFRILDIDSPAYLMGAAADGIMTARLLPAIWQAAIDRYTMGHPFEGGLSPAEAGEELTNHQIVNRWAIRRTIMGLKIDHEFLEQYDSRVGRELADQAQQLQAVGVTPGNGNHLAAYLGSIGQLPLDHPMTEGGRPQTTAKVLEALGHPIAQLFVANKKTMKVRSYLEKCRTRADVNDRIHPVTQILKAVHGRSAISGIELHQFPGPARGIILFDEPGTSIDWTAQEPMLGMNFAHDDGPIRSYEAGERIYTYISEYAGIPDKAAKVVLLGSMYGEGMEKLSADLHLPLDPWVVDESKDAGGYYLYAAARALYDATWSALPRTAEMLFSTFKDIGNQYQLINTMNGRIVPVPSGVQPWNGVWSVQTHKVGNIRICGSAADMMMDTVVECERRGIGDAVYFNMHDEFLTAESVAHEVQTIMGTPSERLCRMAKRRPLIRTDLNSLGERWAVS